MEGQQILCGVWFAHRGTVTARESTMHVGRVSCCVASTPYSGTEYFVPRQNWRYRLSSKRHLHGMGVVIMSIHTTPTKVCKKCPSKTNASITKSCIGPRQHQPCRCLAAANCSSCSLASSSMDMPLLANLSCFFSRPCDKKRQYTRSMKQHRAAVCLVFLPFAPLCVPLRHRAPRERSLRSLAAPAPLLCGRMQWFSWLPFPRSHWPRRR